MALTYEQIKESVTAKFGDAVSDFNEPYGMLTFEVHRDKLFDLVQYLRDDETMGFNFLTNEGGVHFPANEVDRQFSMVYHLHNWAENVRIRIKTYLNGENPEVDSITGLYLCANWMERETYDFYGIIFKGHPDLRRILNMDEMVSFPMRKEYPLEDSGRTDKDDRYFGRLPQSNNVN